MTNGDWTLIAGQAKCPSTSHDLILSSAVPEAAPVCISTGEPRKPASGGGVGVHDRDGPESRAGWGLVSLQWAVAPALSV